MRGERALVLNTMTLTQTLPAFTFSLYPLESEIFVSRSCPIRQLGATSLSPQSWCVGAWL